MGLEAQPDPNQNTTLELGDSTKYSDGSGHTGWGPNQFLTQKPSRNRPILLAGGTVEWTRELDPKDSHIQPITTFPPLQLTTSPTTTTTRSTTTTTGSTTVTARSALQGFCPEIDDAVGPSYSLGQNERAKGTDKEREKEKARETETQRERETETNIEMERETEGGGGRG